MAAPRNNGKRSVRLVKRGDVIKLRDGGEEVVRNVQVILQMANGSNEVYEPIETVEVLPAEELPDLEATK
jgi:hypothetical protein